MSIEVNYLVSSDSELPDGVTGAIIRKSYNSPQDFDKPCIGDLLCLQHGLSETDMTLWKVKEIRRFIFKDRESYSIFCFLER